MLRAFFDDTGTHKGSRITGIGGVLAYTARWDALSEEWARLLDEWGLEWFHMTDAESRREPPYASWSDEQREARITTLSKLVERTTFASFGSHILRADYQATIGEHLRKDIGDWDRDYVRLKSDPYSFAFGNILVGMDHVCTWLSIEKGNVEIIFAEQKSVGYPSRDLWRSLTDKIGFPTPVFKDQRKLPPLQAADMVAWYVNKYVSVGNLNPWPRHHPLGKNLLHCPVSREQLRPLAEQLSQIAREEKGKLNG